MEKSRNMKGFYIITGVVSFLVAILYNLSSKTTKNDLLLFYAVFSGICLVYYIAAEADKDKKRVGAVKTMPQPKVYVNPYDHAIQHDETREFLLGEGTYLYPDYDWAGIHTPSLTFEDIIAYGKLKGNDVMQKRLESDIDEVLAGEVTTHNLVIIKTYIWIYARRFYEEKEGLPEWNISNKTKALFKQQLEKFTGLYGTGGGEFKRNSENNEFNVEQLVASIRLMQERFGINLME